MAMSAPHDFFSPVFDALVTTGGVTDDESLGVLTGTSTEGVTAAGVVDAVSIYKDDAPSIGASSCERKGRTLLLLCV